VIERAYGTASDGELLVCYRFGDTKVHQLYHPGRGNHHVCRFDVSMDDSLGMRVIQRRKHLANVIDTFVKRNRPLLQPLRYGGTFDDLQDEEKLIFTANRRMKRGYIGMIECGEQLDLTQKSRLEISVLRQVRQQDLHRLHPVGDDVPDLIDLAHAS